MDGIRANENSYDSSLNNLLLCCSAYLFFRFILTSSTDFRQQQQISFTLWRCFAILLQIWICWLHYVSETDISYILQMNNIFLKFKTGMSTRILTFLSGYQCIRFSISIFPFQKRCLFLCTPLVAVFTELIILNEVLAIRLLMRYFKWFILIYVKLYRLSHNNLN